MLTLIAGDWGHSSLMHTHGLKSSDMHLAQKMTVKEWSAWRFQQWHHLRSLFAATLSIVSSGEAELEVICNQ